MSNSICNTLTCNKCGKEVEVGNDILESVIRDNTMHNFTVHFSYGSDYDMTKCSFTICERCVLDMILKEFAVIPIFEDDDQY